MKLRDWRPPPDDFEEDPRPRYGRPPILDHNSTPWSRWYKKASPTDVLIFSAVSALALGGLIFFGGLLLLVIWSQI